MSLKSYFWSQTIARFSSRYNIDIRVSEDFGKLNLIVNGSIQSGPLIDKLWRKALTAFGIERLAKVRRILVLGVAGGNVIHILRGWFPSAHITGVEIDPVMIDVGRTYFSLKKDRLFTVVREDARIFVDRAISGRNTYDLVIIDTFFGRHVPTWVSEKLFLMKLTSLVSQTGTIVINFLRENEYREMSDVLLDKLRQIFHSVMDTAIARNRFFCARP